MVKHLLLLLLDMISAEGRSHYAAQKITGCTLPSLNDIFSSRCLGRPANILKDPTHPGHNLFHLQPSGRRYRSLKACTNRLRDSFCPIAIATLTFNYI